MDNPEKKIPQWKLNRNKKRKERMKAKASEFAEKGEADPYGAKKLLAKAEKDKRRACRKFNDSLKMFKQHSAVERYKLEETELGRNAARALKKEAIDDFRQAQEKEIVGQVLAGKEKIKPKAAEKEMLEKIYQ